MGQIRKTVTKFQSDEVAATARDPVIAAALAARARLGAAFAAQNAEETAALFARDLIVNAPSNRVARRDAVLVFFKAGRMDYESGTSTIEALEARGDCVVMMGEEVVKPNETAPNPGKTVRRRFTDVWRKESDGQWRLTIRQATITSVE